MNDHHNLNKQYINNNASLPYSVTISEVVNAVSETYRLLNGVNNFLSTNSFDKLEFLLLGNSLSGIISEFLVKNLAKCSERLIVNERIGGHPDLLPIGIYKTNNVLKGEEGIEVPFQFVEILCAKLEKSDWSFSDRKGTSRRTPTASITTTGVEKLRNNFIYRIPEIGVGKHKNILA
ncbi:MAG: hypothetical protein JXJ04_19460 [Spirochaetales bacterium]|nr:hypothetical protein [Spirochaetales bacterium]